MTKEWLGVLSGLAAAALFGACVDSVDDNGTTSATQTATSSTGGQGGSGGTTVSTGANGGMGGTAGMGGMGGDGGTGGMGCSNVPVPTQPLSCGGTAVTNSTGGSFCETSCTDGNQHVYSVTCDNLGNCSCELNGNEMCSCSDPNAGCSDNCCPLPWQDLVDSGGTGGFGGMGSTSVTVSTGTTSGSSGTGN